MTSRFKESVQNLKAQENSQEDNNSLMTTDICFVSNLTKTFDNAGFGGSESKKQGDIFCDLCKWLDDF